MSHSLVLDSLIIGAGPIGLATSIELQKLGLRYLILEKGCLTNSIYHYPLNMTFFSSSDRLEIGNVPFVSASHRPTRTEALEYYRRVALDFGLKINLFEEVISVFKNEKGLFEIRSSKGMYLSRSLILSTGFYDIPALLNIPGEELSHVHHYYKDPHWFAFRKVVVVGAQNSSVDAALECWRKGADVTMIIRGNSLGERVKAWIRPDIDNRIADGSIKALFNTTLKKITSDHVLVEQEGREEVLEASAVLALTGYEPNYRLLNMLGVELTSDEKQCPIHHEETMETNVSGLYLAGVVCGGLDTHSWFIENSRAHAPKIAAHIASRKNHRNDALLNMEKQVI